MTFAIEAVVDKRYGARDVLRGAKLAVRAGTVHALVGENGAGKSTLVKVIAGLVRADGGTVRTAGHVGLVQQHGAFAGVLSVVDNAVLGREPTRGPLLALDDTARALRELGDKIGLPVDPYAPVDALPLGAAQRAEIVAALHHGAKILMLDEPTAVLAPSEVDGLLAALRALAAAGTTIVIVTHKLDEVRAIADDVTVLRAGETVATFAAPFDTSDIARAMVGGELPGATTLAAPADDARVVLELTGVAAGDLAPVDLRVRAGEIVGVAGVDGNGQRELALAIAGLLPARGSVTLAGKAITRATPAARLAAGLAHISEDRLHGGLWLDASVADNLALGRRDITGRWRVDRAAVSAHARARIAELDVRPPDEHAMARTLSGGNQQKVVVARELSRPNLIAVVAAQPTRGVDLGAVARIHDRLRAAAAGGAGVLVISADLDELLALCHRVVVLLRGQIVGERSAAAANARAQLGSLMTGAS
jgi:simple sugar transport system ATP-binding protein